MKKTNKRTAVTSSNKASKKSVLRKIQSNNYQLSHASKKPSSRDTAKRLKKAVKYDNLDSDDDYDENNDREFNSDKESDIQAEIKRPVTQRKGPSKSDDHLSGSENDADMDTDSNEDEELDGGSAAMSDEDDDHDDDLDDIHDRLLSAINKFSKQNENGDNIGTTSSFKSFQNIPENSTNSTQGQATASMDALLGALDEVNDMNGLTNVKRKLKEFEASLAVPKFVDKTLSQKTERSLVYKQTAEDMSKWQDIVTTNRHERTLDLANDRDNYKNAATMRSLIQKFTPSTDLEKDIQMVLFKTNASEDVAAKLEEDELKARGLTMEEIQAKQAELAKVKARMFYDQMKRHRINKIKSKAFHRIKKRQKEKQKAKELEILKDNDSEKFNEIVEEQAMKRIKERMDLKHKNTGRWARMALEHGKRDASLREAYHEAVQLGHDLLQKHDEIPDASKQDESGDDWSDDSDDEADEGDDDNNMTMKSKKSSSRDKIARKAAKTMAKVIKEGNNEEDAPVIDGKYKKLFDMDFMKRADASKSIRAQDEMKSILKELEFMEDDEEKEYNRDSDDEKYQDFQEDNILLHKPMKKSNKRSSDATSIVTNSTASTSHPVTSKAMSKAQSNNNNVPRPANTVVKDIETAVHHNQSAPIKSVNQSEINMPNPWLEQQEKSTKMEKKAKTGQSSGKVSMNQEDGNKLLIITESTAMKGHFSTKTLETTSKSNADKNTNTNNDKKGTKKTSKESATMNSNASMKAVQSSATTTGNAETSPSPAVPTVQKKPMNERKPLLLQQSQANLVQMAFAGPDLEEEFRVLKEQAISEELGFDDKKKDILSKVKPGWGDWAGPGKMMVSSKIQNIRDRQMKLIEAEELRKKEGRKDNKLPNVVINERRMKPAAKYVIGKVPHPYTSREEYEQAMRMPLGEEWNASHVVKENTQPEILTRAGRVIEPIKLPKKRSKSEVNAAVQNNSSAKRVKVS